MIIKVGNKTIGGGDIPIQTMIKNSPYDHKTTIDKLERLFTIGADIVRITVPDEKSIESLSIIIKESPLPIVADIHFDYKLAIKAIEAGVAKVRINPGNIGDKSRVGEIVACLKEYNIPVRIGINAGSLPEHLILKNLSHIDTMIESACEEINYFEEFGYDKIVLSFKSSNVMETIKVNRIAKAKFGLPLHIGVTEAGDKFDGAIKNSVGISNLLLDNIGDTIRVSLTSSEEDEVIAGRKILEAVGKLTPDIEIISCPTCGRTEVSIENLVAEFKERIKGKRFNKKIKAAIMGCVVNGPGESKDADFGVACGKNKSIIFSEGKTLKTVKNSDILDELIIQIKKYYEE